MQPWKISLAWIQLSYAVSGFVCLQSSDVVCKADIPHGDWVSLGWPGHRMFEVPHDKEDRQIVLFTHTKFRSQPTYCPDCASVSSSTKWDNDGGCFLMILTGPPVCGKDLIRLVYNAHCRTFLNILCFYSSRNLKSIFKSKFRHICGAGGQNLIYRFI